jgi:DNA (cytosine-5)-methyltransferase 1
MATPAGAVQVRQVRHDDLFSGIAGFSLAASWVWGDEYENVGHSEIETYPCKVYHRHFPESRCLGDITKIDWTEFKGIDLITGGFPCQPHSVAGKRKASADERDLWGECVRAVRGVRPQYAVFENVPGLLVSERGRFFNRVITDLAESGYDVEYRILSAQSVGAPHKRDRVWIVAHPQSVDAGREAGGVREAARGQGRALYGESGRTGVEADVAHATQQRMEGNGCAWDTVESENGRQEISVCGRERTGAEWWSVEPNVGRVANGVPSRVDRLKGLGNAIVPQVAVQILQAIKDADDPQAPA